MKTPLEFANAYLAIWNETDPAKRRAQVDATFSDDARYLDPLMSGAGRDGIDAMIGGAQSHFAGCRFTLSGTPDGHGDVARFSWSAALPGHPPAAHGTDVVTIAGGRVCKVIGFLDNRDAQAA